MAFSFKKIGIELDSVDSLKDFLFVCGDINDYNEIYHVQDNLASDIINGLAVFHGNGIGHRDLSMTTYWFQIYAMKTVQVRTLSTGGLKSQLVLNKRTLANHAPHWYRQRL